MVRMQEKPRKTNSGREKCLEEHEGGSEETSTEGICEKSRANTLGLYQGPGKGI